MQVDAGETGPAALDPFDIGEFGKGRVVDGSEGGLLLDRGRQLSTTHPITDRNGRTDEDTQDATGDGSARMGTRGARGMDKVDTTLLP
jgi:hypothetical protein